MYLFAFIVVICVAGEMLYNILMDNTHEITKDLMNYEREFNTKKRVVIQGVFRQHNQQFRDHGYKPPKGTA